MVKKQFRSALFLLSLAAVINGCAIKTKKTGTSSGNVYSQPSKQNVATNDAKPPVVDAVVTVESSETEPAQNEPEKAKPTESQSPIVKTVPKFGFIFSGGGAKSWAHIGVLKELQKLKWPVNSVAGFEWGSAVAALYAQNLSANEVEWELSKLKEFDKWDLFIKAAFAKKMTTDLKIPFVCPSLNIAKQSAYLLNRGQLSQLIPFCIGSTTLTKPINQSVGLLNDVPSLAQHLRATGSNKIILVNVLAQNLKRSFTKDYESSDNIMWAESAALIAKKPIGVDDVIDIYLDDYGIKDLDKRREIANKGSELSATLLKKLAEKYGL